MYFVESLMYFEKGLMFFKQGLMFFEKGLGLPKDPKDLKALKAP